MTFNIWIQDNQGEDWNTPIDSSSFAEAQIIAFGMTNFRGWKILEISPILEVV